MLSSLNLGVKTQKYFVSWSDKLVDEKTLLKIWLNPGQNVTIITDYKLRHVRYISAWAMMVSHTNPMGVETFCYSNTSLCPNIFA